MLKKTKTDQDKYLAMLTNGFEIPEWNDDQIEFQSNEDNITFGESSKIE